jgi:hypothetical protein
MALPFHGDVPSRIEEIDHRPPRGGRIVEGAAIGDLPQIASLAHESAAWRLTHRRGEFVTGQVG